MSDALAAVRRATPADVPALVDLRRATPADVPALVDLRLANAEAHVALDGLTYRIPARAEVTTYFTTAIGAHPTRDAIFVAEAETGDIIGMVEVLRLADPPAHQILRPEPAAQVHTVVLPGVRSQGVGAALLAVAEAWAGGEGIRYLSAGIHHRNAGAARFYARHGYTDAGISRGKRITSP